MYVYITLEFESVQKKYCFKDEKNICNKGSWM